MRSGRRAHPTTAGAGLVAALLVLSGCTLGQASSFTGRADDACAKASSAIRALDPPTDGVPALSYALDRYTDIERLVSEVAEDVGFPGGASGTALKQRWIAPARASLKAGLDELEALREAVRAVPADHAAIASALAVAGRAGTGGVDVAYLAAHGLAACAATFSDPVPAASG